MPVEERFCLLDLRSLLARDLTSSEICVRQGNDQLYILKLDEFRHYFCDQYASEIPDSMTLLQFLSGAMRTAPAWLKCIEISEVGLGPLVSYSSTIRWHRAVLTMRPQECFHKWNTMPSRATYDAVEPTAEPRQLDPESEQDAIHILLASQLARIVCRAVEITAFSYLQKELLSHGQSNRVQTTIEDFVQQLGKTLLTLRWRVSWWTIIGAEGNNELEEQKRCYIDRVKGICRILYVYYFIARRKLPPWSGSDLVSRNGIWSVYTDAASIFERWPHDGSLQGFEQWMMEGQDMIRQAGVPERVAELLPDGG
ncbi:MAG: hypothetical protein Q9219_004243 [cf. Caloplaca sp. 3 TL-2023]